eukprot:jgi/Bigna1/137071/aug1.37_g11779
MSFSSTLYTEIEMSYLIKLSEKRNESLPHDYSVYFTLEELERLLPEVDKEIGSLERHRLFAEDMVEIIKDYNLLRFHPFSVFSPKLLERTAALMDKALVYLTEGQYADILGDKQLAKDWTKLARDRLDEMTEAEKDRWFGRDTSKDFYNNLNFTNK